jgi:hypothetical protein
MKSVYRVDFEYDGKVYAGSLEPYKQDNTATKGYLLTNIRLDLPAGTLLMLPDKNGEYIPWMVYWLENMKASGYNRYIVLKMTHLIKWTDKSKQEYETWAYMYGQEDNMLKDEIKSRSRSDTLYNENLKMSFFVMPVNENLLKDDYFELGEGNLKQGYRVTGYDIVSTPGVEFVTVDPVYLRDRSEVPEKPEDDTTDDFFWLEWGENNNGR